MAAERIWHEKLPEFLSFYLLGEKHLAKFPPNVPQNFPAKDQTNSAASFGRRGRKLLEKPNHWFGGYLGWLILRVEGGDLSQAGKRGLEGVCEDSLQFTSTNDALPIWFFGVPNWQLNYFYLDLSYYCRLELELQLPPGTKPIHAGKMIGELIFAWVHAGPVFALAQKKKNAFEGSFSAYYPNAWGNSFRCKYMSRLYSHPREYRRIFLANYLGIGFVPGGTFTCGLVRISVQFHCYQLKSPERWITDCIAFTFASLIPQELNMQSFAAAGIFSESCRTKAPEFFEVCPKFCPEYSSEFPISFEDFSCFISSETETTKNSPNLRNFSFPNRRKNPQKFSGEQAK